MSNSKKNTLHELPKGVFPVMLTTFREDGSIDFSGVEYLTNYYLEAGATGLFADALPAEVNYLSDGEKVALAKCIVRHTDHHVPVVVGAISDGTTERQAELIHRISESGADVVTIAVSQIAEENEDDEIWLRNIDRLLQRIPESVRLGLYEAPWPYHRLLSETTFRWVTKTGRFYFLKDTCGQIELIKNKIEIGCNSTFKLFNANSQTLLLSLQAGAHGFSGIGANYFPELYVWLCKNFRKFPETSEKIQKLLTKACEIMEGGFYPTAAKEYLRRNGLPITSFCRAKQIGFPENEFDNLKRIRKRANELLQNVN